MMYVWLGALLIATYRAPPAASYTEDMTEYTGDVVHLGLYFVYDEAFKDEATFPDDDGGFNSYFTALAKAAEAHFRDVDDPRIVLTLANSSQIQNESIVIKLRQGRKNLVDGESTMLELERTMTWNDAFPGGVDVVFLITGLETMTKESEITKEWKGMAQPKAICMSDGKAAKGKAVGILNDDGSTFSGAHLLALQMALLLGASKDGTRQYTRLLSDCSASYGYLTSSIKGGFRRSLSECSRRDLREFFLKNKNRSHICWNDRVQAALPKAEMLPAEFYEERDQTACEVPRNGLSRVYECESHEVKASHEDCKIMCCDYLGQKKPITAPDGTKCGKEDDDQKICVYGECI